MALKKKVRMPNGIELGYHRIALLMIDTNNQIRILRYSYVDEEARNIEKAYERGEVKSEDFPTFPYVDADYICFDYKNGMCLEKAYDLLKQLPEFEDAEDC